jgi:hypothetical protein
LDELLELELDELLELEFDELLELEFEELLELEFEELFELEFPANWRNSSVVSADVFAEICRSSCVPVGSLGRLWRACAMPAPARIRPMAAVMSHVIFRMR